MDKNLLTLGEAAELLRVGTKTLYRNVKNVPGAFKVFGSWRFDKEILLAELKRQATAPKGQAAADTSDRHTLL